MKLSRTTPNLYHPNVTDNLIFPVLFETNNEGINQTNYKKKKKNAYKSKTDWDTNKWKTSKFKVERLTHMENSVFKLKVNVWYLHSYKKRRLLINNQIWENDQLYTYF